MTDRQVKLDRLRAQVDILESVLATSEPFSNGFYIQSEYPDEVLEGTIGVIRADIEARLEELKVQIAAEMKPRAAILLTMTVLRLSPDKGPQLNELVSEFDKELGANLSCLAFDKHGKQLLGRWTWKAVPLANIEEETARLLQSNLHFAMVGRLFLPEESNLDPLVGSLPKIEELRDIGGLLNNLGRIYGHRQVERLLTSMSEAIDKLEETLDSELHPTCAMV